MAGGRTINAMTNAARTNARVFFPESSRSGRDPLANRECWWSSPTSTGLEDVENGFAYRAAIVRLGLQALHNRSRRQSALGRRRVVLIETDDERPLEDGVDIVLVIHMPRIDEAAGKPVAK